MRKWTNFSPKKAPLRNISSNFFRSYVTVTFSYVSSITQHPFHCARRWQTSPLLHLLNYNRTQNRLVLHNNISPILNVDKYECSISIIDCFLFSSPTFFACLSRTRQAIASAVSGGGLLILPHSTLNSFSGVYLCRRLLNNAAHQMGFRWSEQNTIINRVNRHKQLTSGARANTYTAQRKSKWK